MSPSIVVTSKQNEKWMKQRKLIQKHSNNRTHLEFAKNLFIFWDDDGSGILEAEELIKPLVGLGLAADSKFTTKLLQALESGSGKVSAKEDLKIKLHDFVKIFKSDKTSDKIA